MEWASTARGRAETIEPHQAEHEPVLSAAV